MKLTKKKRVGLIGKTCIINAIYHNKPDWEIMKIEERPGWIIGFGAIRKGFIENLGWDEGIVFRQLKTISVAKVRFWATEKEFSIPLDAFTIDDNAKPFSSQSQYSEEIKKFYVDNIEEYPRNSKGQFIKMEY